MGTKITVEIETSLDVSPEALAAWVWCAVNVPDEDTVDADIVHNVVPGSSLVPFLTDDIDELCDHDGPIHVRLCPSPASIYPPATEQPEPEMEGATNG